jgi:hypothetical protein
VVEQAKVGWREHLRRPWSKRLLALVVTLALVATTLVVGEPNRPATATVVRPIVTVQALCTAPTIIDVAAGEPTRGLSAVHALLGLEDPLVAEAARETTITETDAGTFFVSIREGQLRLAILRPTGLPALADVGPDRQPQTYRAFDLPVGLADLDTVIVPDNDAVFVLFAGDDQPPSAIRLDVNTLVSDSAGLSAGRAPEGVEVAEPAARPGRGGGAGGGGAVGGGARAAPGGDAPDAGGVPENFAAQLSAPRDGFRAIGPGRRAARGGPNGIFTLRAHALSLRAWRTLEIFTVLVCMLRLLLQLTW